MDSGNVKLKCMYDIACILKRHLEVITFVKSTLCLYC